MNIVEMVRILIENYSLSELEDRLDMDTNELEDGLHDYCQANMHKVDQMLREDLFL